MWTLFNLFPVEEVVMYKSNWIFEESNLFSTVCKCLVDERCVMGFGQNVIQVTLSVESIHI